jgi:adenylate cyclase
VLEARHGELNSIPNQYECPQMNIRIGIDMGENAIIQSGWDIHQGLIREDKDVNDSNTNLRDPPHIKKPVYDVLGYTTNLAVKMTALANPNHMAIGQLACYTQDSRIYFDSYVLPI